MPCDRSGMCCRVIYMVGKDRRPEAVRALADDALDHGQVAGDAIFIDRNWVPISDAEAIAMNPAALLSIAVVRKRGDEVHLYRCVQLDEETSLCRAHEVKPKVCSGYPFYKTGVFADPRRLIWPGCGYVPEVLAEAVEQERDYARRAMLDYLGAECGDVKLKAAA